MHITSSISQLTSSLKDAVTNSSLVQRFTNGHENETTQKIQALEADISGLVQLYKLQSESKQLEPTHPWMQALSNTIKVKKDELTVLQTASYINEATQKIQALEENISGLVQLYKLQSESKQSESKQSESKQLDPNHQWMEALLIAIQIRRDELAVLQTHSGK
ncbi:MAG: hypothetical protein SP1CHLAM9_05330 [Chlamydiia bacterium]|nr:hypothetical protein [Chlamydiia bacterium]MCH9623921.1 hypothetical protein [Chlamydiia bacterium]